jgi:ABC-type branched-subunit amino acid transport system ATPase component
MTTVSAIASANEVPVLQAQDITLRFRGVISLADVSIDLRDNEKKAVE